MREVAIPQSVIDAAARGPIRGSSLEFAVLVDWPELRLTEQQVIENAFARAAGQDAPHPDRSLFSIRVPYATPPHRQV